MISIPGPNQVLRITGVWKNRLTAGRPWNHNIEMPLRRCAACLGQGFYLSRFITLFMCIISTVIILGFTSHAITDYSKYYSVFYQTNQMRNLFYFFFPCENHPLDFGTGNALFSQLSPHSRMDLILGLQTAN